MPKTNWQDPGSSSVLSTHVAGLQDAVGKIEDALSMSTESVTDYALTEVYNEDRRYQLYQAVGKRNWAASPVPVIKKNGVEITTGFSIDYGGGAVFFDPPLKASDTVTATFDCLKAQANISHPTEVVVSSVAPATNKLWLDTSSSPRRLRYYNGSIWVGVNTYA